MGEEKRSRTEAGEGSTNLEEEEEEEEKVEAEAEPEPGRLQTTPGMMEMISACLTDRVGHPDWVAEVAVEVEVEEA